MSIIMTAGNKKVDWSPKEKQDKVIVKTASTEEQEVVEASDEDALFEAAKSVIEAAKKCDDCDCDPCECEEEGKEKEKETKEAASCGDAPVKEDSAMVFDVSDEEEGIEDGGEATVEEAIEKVEDALEEVKDAVGVEGDEVSDDAIVEDEGEVAELEIEVVDEEPVAEEGEIFIESEPACCESCGSALASTDDETKEATTEEVVGREASSGEEFVRYAAISPANRKKLRQYWKSMLNYVPDYVDLMTKDYE